MHSHKRGLAGLSLVLVGVVLSACGGDAATAPEEPSYPAIAGTYAIDATFHDFSPSTAYATGTLSLVQSSRTTGDLTGNLTLTARIGAASYQITGLYNARVSQVGTLTFEISSGGMSSWVFSAPVTSGSAAFTGTHTLAGDGSVFTGIFSAARL